MTILSFIIITGALAVAIHAVVWHDWASQQPMNGEKETLKKINDLFWKKS